MKVLIAEDEIYSAMALQQLLETQGYETQLAYDGLKAYEIFLKGGFQLGILDADMPGLNGYELAQQIRSHEHQLSLTPMVLIHFSGYFLLDQDLEEKGFNAQIQKPIYDPQKMYELIKKVLHTSD